MTAPATDDVIVLSSVCGKHYADDCPSCQSAKASNDYRLSKPAGDVERLLRDLLAVIHRDGGHYTAEYGLARSCEDAMWISSERIAALDAAFAASSKEQSS